MTFVDAIAALGKGSRIARAGWSTAEHKMWIETPEVGEPVIMVDIKRENPPLEWKGVHGPWTPSETDKTATDWAIAP